MTGTQFYPPVALATVVFGIWTIVAYRLYKRDAGLESESLPQVLWLLILPASLCGFYYFHGISAPLTSYFSLFMASLAGISFGGIVIYLIREIFVQQHEPLQTRLFRYFCLAMFSAILLGGFFV